MKKYPLTEYSYTKSGNMIGSYYREEIRYRDEQNALFCVTEASRHDEEHKETSYLISAAILPEIAEFVRKNRMHRWKKKKISPDFIADGSSYGYCFSFGEDVVSFSSQAYPEKYRLVLDRLHAIIKNYTDEKIPLL